MQRSSPLQTFMMIVISLLAAMSAGKASAWSEEVIAAAMEIGITPESLVMADCSTQSAQSILARIDAASAERSAIVAAHAEVATRATAVSSLRRDVSLDPTNEALRQDLENALAALASAQGDLSAAQEDLFDVAMDGFSTHMRYRVTTYRNGMQFKVTAAFRAVERTRSQWRTIEAALRIERRCQRMDEVVPDHVADLLAAVRGDPQVAYAEALLHSGLDTMRQVFVGGQ